MSVILDEFHYHEALDRASLMCDIVSESLENHPVITHHPELRARVEAAVHELFQLYQDLGTMTLKGDTQWKSQTSTA